MNAKLGLFLLVGLVCSSAHAAMGVWTGRSQMVTTVSYQQAWKCEYDVNGQRVWLLFKNSCPGSVEVE